MGYHGLEGTVLFQNVVFSNSLPKQQFVIFHCLSVGYIRKLAYSRKVSIINFLTTNNKSSLKKKTFKAKFVAYIKINQ